MLYRQPVACRDGSKPVCVQHALAPDSMPVHCAVVGMLKTRLSINPSEWAVYLLRYQSQRAGLSINPSKLGCVPTACLPLLSVQGCASCTLTWSKSTLARRCKTPARRR